MSTVRAIASRLAVLAAMVAVPALVLHQHVRERNPTSLSEASRRQGALALQTLAPILERPMASALVEAPAAVAALDEAGPPMTLLFRPHGAATWYHVASNGATAVALDRLSAVLADGCALPAREAELPRDDGPALPVTLTPTSSGDGCWMMVTAADARPPAGADTSGIRLALAAYALSVSFLAAMVCPLDGGRPDGRAGAPVNLSALARELAQALAVAQGERLTIGTVVADGVWVRARASRLKSDFAALLAAAVAATPAGGFVGIRLQAVDGTGVLTIEHEKPIEDMGDLRRHVADLGGRLRTGMSDHGHQVVIELPVAAMASTKNAARRRRFRLKRDEAPTRP